MLPDFSFGNINSDDDAVKNISNADDLAWKTSAHWDADLLKMAELSPGPLMDELLEAVNKIPGVQPHIRKIETTILELFGNGLDHGVLGLSSALKASAEGFVDYYRARKTGLQALRQGDIFIQVQYFSGGVLGSSGGKVEISVTDSGEGFDFESVINSGSVMEATTKPYGRGLMLIGCLCDELEFFDQGNRVKATISWSALH